MSARRQSSIPRSAALIALAALAVHQLRYLLAYGSASHEELSRQGHAYLTQALPLLVGFAAAALLAGLLKAAMGAVPRRVGLGAARLRTLGYAASIVSVFAVQEMIEGLLFAGHASGTAAVLGAVGWLALPLAGLFGALCAAVDGGLAKLEALVAPGGPPGPRRRAPQRLGAQAMRLAAPLASLPLAFGVARRPPPLSA
jgi:hypothetical protein